jgi:hypothetical protein
LKQHIAEQYFAPTLAVEQLRERSVDGNPLAEFSDAFRRELKALRDAT